MTKHSHPHPKGHPHHHNNAEGHSTHSHKKVSLHKILRRAGGVIVVGLMLLGMIMYVLSLDEEYPPGENDSINNPNPEMPAAE